MAISNVCSEHARNDPRDTRCRHAGNDEAGEEERVGRASAQRRRPKSRGRPNTRRWQVFRLGASRVLPSRAASWHAQWHTWTRITAPHGGASAVE